MKTIKIFFAVALLSLSASAVAQDLESGYFTDGYLYRHDMNPAIGNEQSYVSMPALGNFNTEVRGTLGLKDVLYNVNGRTTTFMNPNVSTEEVLKNIKESNQFGMNLKLQVLGAGFKSFGGYSTIEVNVRADVNAGIPGTLFRAVKEGLTNKTYDFSDLSMKGQAYGEIALGHSHKIGDKLHIGAKVKALLGVGNVEANFKKANLTLGEDKYTANVNAEVKASIKDLTFEHDTNENTGHKYVSGVDDAGVGLSGFGLGLDLGAEYEIMDGLKVSASVVDLGFINYKNTYLATTNGDKTFSTDKYIFNTDDDATNNFDDELDNMTDDLSKLYELDDKGDQGSTNVSLSPTFRVGAEYALPVYKNLTFGVLNTTKTGTNSWTEFRVSANIAPVKFFSLGANVVSGTFGTGFGGIINIHPTGFNLYVAFDRTPGSFAKQGVPLNSNASVSMGINFPF